MKPILSSFTGTVVIQAVTMISGVLTARLLLPVGKGELTAIVLWPTLLTTLGSLGIWDAITFYSAGRDPKELGPLLGSALALSLGLALILMAVGYFVIPLVLSRYPGSTISSARLYLAFIPLTFVTVSAMAALQGRQSFSAYNSVRTLVYIGELLGVVGLYLTHAVSVRAVMLAFLGSRFITATVATVLASRLLPNQVGFDLGLVRRLLAYGSKAHLGAMADSLNLRLDQLLMSAFLASSTLGLYVVAVNLSAAATIAAGTLNIVLFPRVAAAASAPLKRQLLGRFMRLSLVCSLGSAAAIYGALPWVIRLFYGAKFLAAIPSAHVLIAAAVVLSANTILLSGAKAFNLPIAASQAQGVGLAFTAVLLMVFLPSYQGYGAAWASLIAYAATFAYLTWLLGRRVGLSVRDLFVPTGGDWAYLRGVVAAVAARFRRTEVDPREIPELVGSDDRKSW
jgi:O-antigen/teichoic acid export membrane protein